MSADFLPNLTRRLVHGSGDAASRGSDGTFFFKIYMASDGSARLAAVDSSGDAITPDYRYYRGEQAMLLKAMESIRRENRFNISWGREDDKTGVSLAQHKVGYGVVGIEP